eukprot:13021831-Alexandrium_andersonii.AAC.1
MPSLVAASCKHMLYVDSQLAPDFRSWPRSPRSRQAPRYPSLIPAAEDGHRRGAPGCCRRAATYCPMRGPPHLWQPLRRRAWRALTTRQMLLGIRRMATRVAEPAA